MYKKSDRAYIGKRISKEFSGKLHTGVVKFFAGKSGTEFVKKGGKQGGGSDYWMIIWDDQDFGEVNKSELLAGLMEHAKLEREAAHRFDALLCACLPPILRAFLCSPVGLAFCAGIIALGVAALVVFVLLEEVS